MNCSGRQGPLHVDRPTQTTNAQYQERSGHNASAERMSTSDPKTYIVYTRKLIITHGRKCTNATQHTAVSRYGGNLGAAVNSAPAFNNIDTIMG